MGRLANGMSINHDSQYSMTFSHFASDAVPAISSSRGPCSAWSMCYACQRAAEKSSSSHPRHLRDHLTHAVRTRPIVGPLDIHEHQPPWLKGVASEGRHHPHLPERPLGVDSPQL